MNSVAMINTPMYNTCLQYIIYVPIEFTQLPLINYLHSIFSGSFVVATIGSLSTLPSKFSLRHNLRFFVCFCSG